MNDVIDEEIEAIRTILKTLQSLDEEAKNSVLEYVLKRLGFSQPSIQPSTQPSPPGPPPKLPPSIPPPEVTTHIEELKNQKQPQSAIEMAVLVAYYLANMALEEERKDRVTTKDLETYFKIANFPLPTRLPDTLPNSKKAGYFDSAGRGQYKLNPVGYNLAAHSMPRSTEMTSLHPQKKRISKGKPSQKAKVKKPLKKAAGKNK